MTQHVCVCVCVCVRENFQSVWGLGEKSCDHGNAVPPRTAPSPLPCRPARLPPRRWTLGPVLLPARRQALRRVPQAEALGDVSQVQRADVEDVF